MPVASNHEQHQRFTGSSVVPTSLSQSRSFDPGHDCQSNDRSNDFDRPLSVIDWPTLIPGLALACKYITLDLTRARGAALQATSIRWIPILRLVR